MSRPSSSPPPPPSPRDAVIVAAVRTPLCRARKGALAGTPPSTLLTAALRGVLSSVSSEGRCLPSDVQDVCVGNVLSPASGAVGMRMASISAGIPHTASLSTVNRQCSSGLQAVSNVANAIRAGEIDVGIGAGVESMSTHNMAKMPPPDVDWTVMKGTREAMDCLIPMGVTSENVTKKYGLKRSDLDAFAAESHRRASAAQAAGKFDEEIVPVLVTSRDGEGSALVSRDDGIRAGTTAGVLSKLKPVFDRKSGSTTAGNSSQMTDGAAAVLLMSRAEAERRGVPVLAVWRSYAVRGVPPAVMGIGPAVAIPAALESAGVTKEDVDVYEINEAFASQASWCVTELGLDTKRVNPNGGAIALGHPLGCTGARQIATLISELRREGGRYGVVSMCIGTGMGAAAVIEMEPRAIESRSQL